MRKHIAMLLTVFGIAIGAEAQSFTQRLQRSSGGQGTVTLHQDVAIDELVNGPENVQTQKPQTQPKAKDKPQSKDKDTKKTQQQPPATQQREATAATAAPADTTSARPRRNYKTTGYRVQAFAGGDTRRDRQKAEQTGNALRQLFPGEEVYVHFYPPRWICRIGNYRTYEEALHMVHEIRKMGYEQATVVKGKIVVQY